MAILLDRLVNRIERMRVLDRPSDKAASLLRQAIRPGPIEDTLSGTPLGHPAHPLLVTVPLGAWTSALALDALGADDEAVSHLVALGNLTALPAALTGATEWLTTAGAERRVGVVHAIANYTGLALHTASWFARRRGNRARGTALSAAGLAMVGVAGWLGGHLTYALGVGVDTTAVQKLPTEWTDAAAAADVTERPTMVEVDAVPVLLYRAADEIVAMADRCTHRGGPLHEGDLDNGCIICPWHGSSFAADGTVRSGPATRPQPTLEVRVEDGRVLLRRSEERALRTNPVGR